MVYCDMPLFIVVILQQWEIDDPDKIVSAIVNKAKPSTHFET
jgi:hypothetical protein